jgi:probable F420-dependent oxidoreductase
VAGKTRFAMSGPVRPFRFGLQVGSLMDRAELTETARMAEDLGYAVFSCTDHLDQSFPQLSPMLALATVAAATVYMELQPLVLANGLHHPVVLAKEAATLDVLSDGRFSHGLGAGWLAADFHNAGMEFHRPGIRVARVAEAIAILRGLQSGEPFDFQGKHYTVSGLAGSPVPRRAIPLLLAGSGPSLLSLGARKADTVALNPGLPPGFGDWQGGATPYADATDRKVHWIREAAAERIDDPEIQTSVMAGGITTGDPQALLAPVAAMLGVPVSKLAGSPHVLAGTVEQCVDTVRQWRERWGISYITFPAALAREMAPVVSALRGA